MKTKAIVCCREWLLEAYYLRMFMQLSNIHSSLYYSSEVICISINTDFMLINRTDYIWGSWIDINPPLTQIFQPITMYIRKIWNYQSISYDKDSCSLWCYWLEYCRWARL